VLWHDVEGCGGVEGCPTGGGEEVLLMGEVVERLVGEVVVRLVGDEQVVKLGLSACRGESRSSAPALASARGVAAVVMAAEANADRPLLSS